MLMFSWNSSKEFGGVCLTLFAYSKSLKCHNIPYGISFSNWPSGDISSSFVDKWSHQITYNLDSKGNAF